MKGYRLKMKSNISTTTGGRIIGGRIGSMKDVTGYTIQATDGEIGHVDDFIIDDETWVIRYLYGR